MADQPQRKTIRLQGYDYRAQGAYFVTICTHNRDLLWGHIRDQAVHHSPLGNIAHNEWQNLESRYVMVGLDVFVVMPNHVHGVVVLYEDMTQKRLTLSQVVGAYKSRVTSLVNAHLSVTGYTCWQRSYYERIIRDEAELNRIRLYIAQNPANWVKDEHHRD